MSFIQKINIVGLLFILCSSQMVGQNGKNPFEIQHRADKKAKESGVNSNDLNQESSQDEAALQNPFNVIRTPQKSNAVKITPPSARTPKLKKEKKGSSSTTNDVNFRFSLTLAMLIFLALSVTIYRSQMTRAYQAFTNENVMKMLHREKGTVAYVPYYILYGLFLFNLGIYLYLLLRFYNLTPDFTNTSLLLMTTGLAVGLFFLKHLVLNVLGWIFPIQKETSIYSMTITIFGTILGIILFVANVIIAYAPPHIIPVAIYISLAIIGIIYFFRSIRGLSIASTFLNRNKFHFFIYLCAVEIAPVLILWKLATSGTGIQ